jgi:hypothetical protein
VQLAISIRFNVFNNSNIFTYLQQQVRQVKLLNYEAVYIVNDVKIAKILVDPMRRAILDLLRQRPMTQAVA